MSSRINLRLSPKSGALTAHTLIVPLILLTIRVANASLSISSAMIKRERPVFETPSKIGKSSFTVLNLLSAIRIYGFSNKQDIVLLSVTK